MEKVGYHRLRNALSDKPHIHVKLVETDLLDWQVYFAIGQRMSGYSLYNPRNLHIQDYLEIIVHFSSGRKFISRDRIFTAGRGDFIIFPTETAHMGVNTAQLAYNRSYVFINPELLEYLPDGKAIAELFTPDSPPLRSLPVELKTPILSKIAAIASPPELDAAGIMRLRFLLYELLGELAYSSYAVPLDNKHPKLLSDALECIGREFAVLHSSHELAERLGVSESYLSRLFAEHLQTSPYRHLRSVRMLEAKRLLSAGASVTDACYCSGFGDLSHFIADFKKENGVTPAKWRHDTDGSSD